MGRSGSAYRRGGKGAPGGVKVRDGVPVAVREWWSCGVPRCLLPGKMTLVGGQPPMVRSDRASLGLVGCGGSHGSISSRRRLVPT